MKFLNFFNIVVFPVIAIILGVSIFCQNSEVFSNPEAVMYTYIDHALKGQVGYGFNVKNNNDVNFEDLEPGDIVLGAYPGCAYGRFSHAALYIGEGKVIEGYVDYGIHMRDIEHFKNYNEICLLRVNVCPEVKRAAVKYAREHIGRMFYPIAFKPGDRIFNCTKIMWQAYYVNGVELDNTGDFWVSPDIFYNSPVVEVIEEKGI